MGLQNYKSNQNNTRQRMNMIANKFENPRKKTDG